MTVSLILYSRPGCHLCDEMKAVVERVGRVVPLSLDVVDITSDPTLEGRYGLEIPVLLVNGRRAAKYRVTEEELTKVVVARAGGAGS